MGIRCSMAGSPGPLSSGTAAFASDVVPFGRMVGAVSAPPWWQPASWATVWNGQLNHAHNHGHGMDWIRSLGPVSLGEDGARPLLGSAVDEDGIED